jgi:hypothetical protein
VPQQQRPAPPSLRRQLLQLPRPSNSNPSPPPPAPPPRVYTRLPRRSYGFLWNLPSFGSVSISERALQWVSNATKGVDLWIT